MATFTSSFDADFDHSFLPQWAVPGAILLRRLVKAYSIDTFAFNLKLNRQGGFQGFEAFALLVLFFASPEHHALLDFCDAVSSYRFLLAALVDYQSLPTQSSLSRLLRGLEWTEADCCSKWLLQRALNLAPMLNHPACLFRDAAGTLRHVFDIDCTSTVLRHRALPTAAFLPAPKRRSAQCKKGYTGRKRGGHKFDRTVLQHAGSSLWLGNWLAPGNAPWRKHSQMALDSIVELCGRLGVMLQSVLVRADGAAGNTPFIYNCQSRGLLWLVRFTGYSLLDLPQVQAILTDASPWLEVEDTESGPKRMAKDLGVLTLPCAKDSLQDDDSSFPEVKSRVVVSRFKASHKHGAGELRDGWHYELFATGLPDTALLAPEVVTEYFRRSGLENRLCQEDRELELDHGLCTHLPGQQFATSVGLALWNFRLLESFRLHEQDFKVPPQRQRLYELVLTQEKEEDRMGAARPTETADTLPSQATESPVSEGSAEATPPEPATGSDTVPLETSVTPVLLPSLSRQSSQTLNGPSSLAEGAIEREASVLPTSSSRALGEAAPSDPLGSASQSPLPSGSKAELEGKSALPDTSQARAQLSKVLSGLDWTRLPLSDTRWRPAPERLGLVCPNEELLRLADVRPCTPGQTLLLRFRSSQTYCRHCRLRSECTRSLANSYMKEVVLAVPYAQGEEVTELLRRIKGVNTAQNPSTEAKPEGEAAQQRENEGSSAPKALEGGYTVIGLRYQWRPGEPGPLTVEGERPAWVESLEEYGLMAGRLVPSPANLLPAHLRHEVEELSPRVQVRIKVEAGKEPPSIKGIATDPWKLSRRRQDWSERIRRYRLTEGSPVSIRYSCSGNVGEELKRYLEGSG